MRTTLLTTILLCASLLQLSCAGDTPAFGTGGDDISETGIPSIENFRLTFSDGWAMTLLDANGGGFTHGENNLVVHAFDRSGAPVQYANITFAAEWGNFPSGTTCSTDASGSCSVTWQTADTAFRPSDNCVRIVAYTTGEESFRDSNGDNIFDQTDTTAAYANVEGFTSGFVDLTSPFYDIDDNNSYSSATDLTVPGFVSPNATADNAYNGSATCTTTNFCSTTETLTIWDGEYIDLKDESTADGAPDGTPNVCI